MAERLESLRSFRRRLLIALALAVALLAATRGVAHAPGGDGINGRDRSI